MLSVGGTVATHKAYVFTLRTSWSNSPLASRRYCSWSGLKKTHRLRPHTLDDQLYDLSTHVLAVGIGLGSRVYMLRVPENISVQGRERPLRANIHKSIVVAIHIAIAWIHPVLVVASKKSSPDQITHGALAGTRVPL